MKKKINLLNSINFIWERDDENTWKTRFIELKEFLKSNNGKFPKFDSSLGLWISRQRKVFKVNKLDIEKIKLLKEIGLNLNPYLDEWDKQYANLKKYEIKNGHSSPPVRTKLGSWVGTQRMNYKKKTLSKERIAQLKRIKTWTWSAK